MMEKLVLSSISTTLDKFTALGADALSSPNMTATKSCNTHEVNKMIIATIIYVICVFALMLHYQRKIKKLKKENRRLSDVRKLLSDVQEKTKFSVCFIGIQDYYDGYSGTELGIRRFADETTMKCWSIFKDNYERLIYGALWDKLVTDDRTAKDNRKMIKVEIKIPYIQMNEKSIEARIYE